MDTTPTPEVPVTQPIPPAPQPFVGQGSPLHVAPEPDASNSAVTIVWQWVTYGLWEWALISLAILLSTTLSYFFDNANGSSSYTFDIYVLAAMLCLLPLAVISNFIYSKKETNPKHGFAAVIMVINAVGVFLATIGALIVLVVSILSLFTSANPSTSLNIVITSSLIVMALGAMLFVRIINPTPLAWFAKVFPFIVLAVAGVAVVLAVVGPFRSQVVNRQDRLIESNLSTLNSDIQLYVSDNSKLPASLADVDTAGDQGVQSLVTAHLVTFTPGSVTDGSTGLNTNDTTSGTTTVFNYQLCVTYKSALGNNPPVYTGRVTPAYSEDTYALTAASYSHPAGHKCYSMTTSSSN